MDKIKSKLVAFGAALLITSTFYACKPNQIIAKKVSREFKNSEMLDKYQVGFALYDMASSEMIFQKDADKYFTPASNTKLFTFYAGLKIAPDSIPSLRYVEKGDSLIFWGTGDPSLLHTVLKGTKAIEALKNSNKKLFFADGRYTGNFFGNGWSWDDYNDYYQPEITEMPLFDNVVLVTSKQAGEMNISPKMFNSCFIVDSANKATKFSVQREFLTNKFHYPLAKTTANYEQQIPFKTSTGVTLTLLADTLKKNVELINYVLPKDAKTVYSAKSDDVFRQLMLPSDNFVAEQLLLTYADKLGLEMSTPKVIAAIQEKYLTELPDKPKWVDGSGLSRGNLFTPRSLIKLLEMIYKEVNDQQRLFSMLPAGGKTGTLRNAYPKTDTPFVFGKTGTLSGVHNQSGYVITKKGKLLLYSFMNNNYVQSTAEIRKEMVRVMSYIHDNF
ncbi:D-alanyl-D-alanine carboxypeptidase/D-alanyl-D-alanine-endopeptidase [Pedobacter ureilyticus]|uniref:D-alanyl-D-alanine carboxypeptidase/D-alanyl-D-alanine-endopeptidase n=1 Tax=Pedobacter ureilyticus TaxID=1393051 RepID=A0ABW9J6M7_9SPHI|nr:D-alanyl-D-alanine carboxypeptidase [Pedobacter helvus]